MTDSAETIVIYPPVRADWLSLCEEEVLDPDLPIVDPHHHLWERESSVYMVDDLAHDLGSGHRIVATVYVQCRSMYREHGPGEFAPVGETEFTRGVAENTADGALGRFAICAGIVGHANMMLGDRVRPVLEAHCDAGGGRFRGIRHITAWDSDPRLLTPGYPVEASMLADNRFREGFAHLAPLGLSFDVWIYHPQIAEVAALARAFPETTIILDHCGGPLGIGRFAGRRDEVFRDWSAAIRDLATCPNVAVKTGGLAMGSCGHGFHTEPVPPDSNRLADAWRPWIETCIEAFGARRCMFESNFPVDKGSCSYRVCWNAFKKLASGVSATERSDLFAGTAARTYRIDATT